jgi:hypothetical protein
MYKQGFFIFTKPCSRLSALVASMVMLESTVEEAVTIERESGDSWELPVREAVLFARERGRTTVVVVHSWQLNPDSLADFETVGVNGNGRAASVNSREVAA